MTVFLAHAPANRQTAEELERFLERRGQFVELEDGGAEARSLQPSDALVLLLSKDLAIAPMRLRLEQRALEAWAEQRLIVVKLDRSAAPIGLRDLPSVDASVKAKRELSWQEIAAAIGACGRAKAASHEVVSAPQAQAKKRKPLVAVIYALAMIVLMLPGLIASAALISIWLANRIGSAPGGWAELRAGVDALGARYGVAPLATETALALAVITTIAVLLACVAGLFVRRSRETSPVAEAPTENPPVFVSYARANAAKVAPVIKGASRAGCVFRMDRKLIGAGDDWAGEIVRAIRGAADVVVVCSKAAFESDHVKREIYLADRYQKRLVPVFIEDATPPEDFEPFFAGVQFLNLFDTPEAERPRALAAALGANA